MPRQEFGVKHPPLTIELMGGIETPASMLRNVKMSHVPPAEDATGRSIVKLAALHPGILRVRAGDMERIGQDSKKCLLSDMRSVLGIRPFRRIASVRAGE